MDIVFELIGELIEALIGKFIEEKTHNFTFGKQLLAAAAVIAVIFILAVIFIGVFS